MKESATWKMYMEKLQGVCDANNLVPKLVFDRYPIHLIVKPADGFDEQITMLEAADSVDYNPPDSSIVFSMRDGGLVIRTSERFSISEALLNKFKNLFKNLHYTYLQMFHRDVLENGLLRGNYEPPTSLPTDDPNDEPITEPLEVCELPDEPGMDGEMPDFDDDILEDGDGE